VTAAATALQLRFKLRFNCASTALQLQTADGRNYSTQLRRNSEEQHESRRCARLSIYASKGNRARREADAPVLFYHIPPVCVL